MPGSCCSRHGSHVAQEIQWTAGHVQWLRTTVQELDDRDLVRGTTAPRPRPPARSASTPTPTVTWTTWVPPRRTQAPRRRLLGRAQGPRTRSTSRTAATVRATPSGAPSPPSATGTKTANAASQRSQLSQHGRVVGATWQTRAHLGRSHDAEEPESPRPWLTPSSHDAGNDEGPEPLRFRAFVTEPPIRIELMTFSLRVRRSTD